MNIQKIRSHRYTIQIWFLSKEKSTLQSGVNGRYNRFFSILLYECLYHYFAKFGIYFVLPCRISTLHLSVSSDSLCTSIQDFFHICFLTLHRTSYKTFKLYSVLSRLYNTKIQGSFNQSFQFTVIALHSVRADDKICDYTFCTLRVHNCHTRYTFFFNIHSKSRFFSKEFLVPCCFQLCNRSFYFISIFFRHKDLCLTLT